MLLGVRRQGFKASPWSFAPAREAPWQKSSTEPISGADVSRPTNTPPSSSPCSTQPSTTASCAWFQPYSSALVGVSPQRRCVSSPAQVARTFETRTRISPGCTRRSRICLWPGGKACSASKAESTPPRWTRNAACGASGAFAGETTIVSRWRRNGLKCVRRGRRTTSCRFYSARRRWSSAWTSPP